MNDFDDWFFFSFAFFHICSIIFLLLRRQFKKILRDTKLWRLSKLINLICDEIINNYQWCEIKLFNDKMKFFWKNFFSRLLNFIIWIYIFSYFDFQNYIFQFFNSQIKIVWNENQHNVFEKDFIIIHWRKKFEIQKIMLIYFEL